MVALRSGAAETAWDQFLGEYRRLIFAAIRHYVRDHDDVMDVFARVCESLREDDLRRLRTYLDHSEHRARFSTWLVVVVRHVAVDWLRSRDGRRRLSVRAERLPPMGRRIYEHVFVEHRSHIECFELICTRDPPGPSYRQFLVELRNTYRALSNGVPGRPLAELAAPVPPDTWNDVASLVVRDRLTWLGRALEVLSPEDRTAVQLYIVEELPAAEVARVLGWPNPKAVYNRVYRALEAVRGRLNEAGIRLEDL